jgi:hypothetical protein
MKFDKNAIVDGGVCRRSLSAEGAGGRGRQHGKTMVYIGGIAVNQLTRMALLLGLAGSLMAQTLSFGEITLVIPVTTPPTYVVNVILTGGSSVAGLQFDLNYDPTQLNVTIGVGSDAAAISKELSSVCLGQALPGCPTPAAYNPSTTAAANAGPGQRAIITGVGLTDTSVSTTGGPSTFSSPFTTCAPCVVGTLTVQATSATPSSQTLTLLGPYLAGTTAGALNVAATSVTLTIGPGSSDPGATGILNLANTYQVGDTYPFTGDNLPNFGNGLDINDAIQVLFAVDSVTGYSLPGACTDRFDAMDSYPQDAPTTRGGNQIIDINDAIVTLFRVDSVQGYATHPVRTSLGQNGTCTTGITANVTAKNVLPMRQPVSRPPLGGTLVLGTAEPSGNGQVRVPVYLQGGRDLPRLAFTFGLGDLQSQLQFQAASEITPTLVVDNVKGVIVAAWLGGIDVRAGQRVLLGYVVAPAGAASNLKVFGSSAAGLNDHEVVGLDVSGR